MNCKINLVSFKENRILFSNLCEINNLFDFDFFKFKKIDVDKFLVLENFKKIIVHTNEVFTVCENQFVFTRHKDPINVLFSRFNENDHLILLGNNFFNFIIFFHKNCYHFLKLNMKNPILFFSKIGFFLSMSLFVFFEENKIKPDIIDHRQFFIQKEIYSFYQNLVRNSAVEEPIQEPVVKYGQGIIAQNNKGNSVHNHKNNLKLNKSQKIDSELEYFLKIIRKKRGFYSGEK